MQAAEADGSDAGNRLGVIWVSDFYEYEIASQRSLEDLRTMSDSAMQQLPRRAAFHQAERSIDACYVDGKEEYPCEP